MLRKQNKKPETDILGEYLTKETLCAELDISPRTLERWITERRAPPRTRAGKKVLWRRASVLEWLRRHEDGAEAAA